MIPQERAINMIQEIGITPLQVDKGVTLNFEYSKAIALKWVKHLIDEERMWQNGEVKPFKYWEEVEKCIQKISL